MIGENTEQFGLGLVVGVWGTTLGASVTICFCAFQLELGSGVKHIC